MRARLYAPEDVSRESRDGITTERAAILRRLGSWSCWAGLALVLYILSIGPVVKLMIKRVIPEGVVTTVYAPMIWLGETKSGKKILDPFFNWYGEKIWRWKDIF
jgi:hypothetical protein